MDEGGWPTKKYDWEKVRRIMLARQARGDQLYTGAYMLNAHGTKPDDPKDKAFFTTKLVLDSAWRDRGTVDLAFSGRHMKDAWHSLLPHHGWGPFTAYEVVCDARYTRYGERWIDTNTWANAGPGAKRGLNRLMGRPLKEPWASTSSLVAMRLYFEALVPRWPYEPALELREIEHCLCEFDKYERARLGEGRPRSKYQGV
jgi:hypothetical protein